MVARNSPKPDIAGAKNANEAFDRLIIACPEYGLQKSQGWIPVLMKCDWRRRSEAVAWIKTQGDRFNPVPVKQQLAGMWGTPEGIWNLPCGSLVIFRNKSTAVQFKLLYG